MFENPGKKLKSFASILFCISAIGCVIGGISVINSGSTRYGNPLVGIGLVLIVGGVIVSYVMSLFIYGFGELIENSKGKNSENAKADKPSEILMFELIEQENAEFNDFLSKADKSALLSKRADLQEMIWQLDNHDIEGNRKLNAMIDRINEKLYDMK